MRRRAEILFSIKKTPPPSGSGLRRESGKLDLAVKCKVTSDIVETWMDLVDTVLAAGDPPVMATWRL